MDVSARFKRHRLRHRDWTGDAVLTLIAGGLLTVAVFLPWANVHGPGSVNFSLHRGAGINGVLQTRWGVPALLLALAVVATGAVMLARRPRRLSWVLGLLAASLGGAAAAVAWDSAGYVGFLGPGVGMYLTTLVGILLVPIGLAAALVALFLARAERETAGPPAPTGPAPTPPAPPAPENAPPS